MGDEIITGKIYALKSSQTDKIYIGSTTRKLKTRFNEHCSHHKRFLNNQEKYKTTSGDIIRYDDCYIELIKEVCCSIEKLRILEGEEIKKYSNAVNCGIAGNEAKYGGRREYKKMLENTDKRKQYKVEYNKKQHTIKQNCLCGGIYSKAHKSRHEKTQKHIKYISEKI